MTGSKTNLEDRRKEGKTCKWFGLDSERKQEIKIKYINMKSTFIIIITACYNAPHFLKPFRQRLWSLNRLSRINEGEKQGTGRKIELYNSYWIYQRSGTELVTCGNKRIKFQFQDPHLTTLLSIKVLLLLMDIFAEAVGLNRAKQYSLLGF